MSTQQVQLSTDSYGNHNNSVDNSNDFRFKILFQNFYVVLNYRRKTLSRIFHGRLTFHHSFFNNSVFKSYILVIRNKIIHNKVQKKTKSFLEKNGFKCVDRTRDYF